MDKETETALTWGALLNVLNLFLIALALVAATVVPEALDVLLLALLVVSAFNMSRCIMED